MADTRSSLIADATTLVRRRGYSGFSYADLAEAVGIRKPSIHHHFPSKEDLGVEIVAAYTQRVSERLDDITAASPDLGRRLGLYAGLYREGIAAGEGCLCGVLASELAGLPARIRSGVERFFALNLEWLERALLDAVLARTKRRTELARRQARTVLATFQGAVFVALATRSPETFDAAVSGLLSALGQASPDRA